MNILIITQWFNPEPNNMKALIFAKGLMQRGNNVRVITGFPNYPQGKVYPGYELSKIKREIVDGVKVIRVWLYPSHDSNKWHRIWNYLSFGLSARINGEKALKGKFDVVYVYHPPLTSIIPALYFKRKYHAKLLMDINDLWPDTLSATGMVNNKAFLKVAEIGCMYSYKRADRINVLSEGIKKLLVSRGVPENKITVIPVWCNEEIINSDINQEFYNKHLCAERFTAIYAGAIGNAQDIQTLVKMAEALQYQYEKFQLIIIGAGVCTDSIQRYIVEHNIKNVTLLPSVSSDKISSILNCADVLMVHLKKDKLFSVTVPSKIPFYMALKKPMVVGLEGDAAKIISDAKNGIVCEPGNVKELSEAMIDMMNSTKEDLRKLAENGYQYYVNNLSMDAGIDKFNQAFLEMTKNID